MQRVRLVDQSPGYQGTNLLAMRGCEMNKNLLFQYIQEALNSIDENGEPDFTCRCKLRNLLGKEVVAGKQASVIWLLAEIIAAKKILPIWEAAFPSEDMPIKLLYEAEKHLLQPKEITISEKDMRAFRADLDDISLPDEEDFSPLYAGYACWTAASKVLLGIGIWPDCDPETELDPEEWDASFFASLAYSGGAIWEEGVGNPVKRREYWEWFFREAIPQAVSQFC
jgi:hypothetical protein